MVGSPYNGRMTRILRLLLCTCLALAVPLQGLAGVTMASCSGTHAAHSGVEGHDHHALGQGSGHGDHGPAMRHAGHDMGPEFSGGESGGHDCAACAACCSLSPVPTPALAAATPERPSSQPIPFFESAHPSAHARGLERPPSTPFLG